MTTLQSSSCTEGNPSLSNENWIEGIFWRLLGTPTLSSRFYTYGYLRLKRLSLCFASCIFLKRSILASVSRNFSVHFNICWTSARSVDLGIREKQCDWVIEDKEFGYLLLIRQMERRKIIILNIGVLSLKSNSSDYFEGKIVNTDYSQITSMVIWQWKNRFLLCHNSWTLVLS